MYVSAGIKLIEVCSLRRTDRYTCVGAKKRTFYGIFLQRHSFQIESVGEYVFHSNKINAKISKKGVHIERPLLMYRHTYRELF